MSKRRVLGITAIRSEYYLQKPIFQAIMDHPGLELELVVTGAHLHELHGHTVNQVEADGFPIVERIESLIHSDHDADRLRGAATQLGALTRFIDQQRPDWLLAPADREESMMMALCGAYLNIPTAHYAAGDRVIGNVDDMVRHAVSRLSHILMTTHEEARSRLIRAGEEEWRVHNVGHAGLDRIRTAARLTPEQLARALDVSAIEKPYIIIVQHPLSSEISQAGEQMHETLKAAEELGLQTFISYPNSDPGGTLIIKALEAYRSVSRFHIFRNIPDIPFVNLLRDAAALIGNSSLGLLEAPFLNLPVINVGRRQTARQHAENVVFVPHDRAQIVRQVRAILERSNTHPQAQDCSNPFGDGRTGMRVAELLAAIPIDAKLLNKDISY